MAAIRQTWSTTDNPEVSRVLWRTEGAGPLGPFHHVDAVILAGEIPFFVSEPTQMQQAEIGRFIARNCDGRCSMDPVALPDFAMESMGRWTGQEVAGPRDRILHDRLPSFGGGPDWARDLRNWIVSGAFRLRPDGTSDPALSERQYLALRAAFRLLSGAPFKLDDRVRNLAWEGWGPNRDRHTGYIEWIPKEMPGKYRVRVDGSHRITATVDENNMMRWG